MKTRTWIISLIGFLIVVFYLFPIYWMAVSSLKTESGIYGAPSLFPKAITLQAYINIFTENTKVFSYLLNSFIISCGALIGTLILATPAAYALARKKIKGALIFLLVVLVVQMFPSNMLALPLYTMFAKMDLLNTYSGVIIADMTIAIPFVIIVLRTYFLNIPASLEDAASIDGCSKWGTFFRVVLPLVRPGLLTCASFSFLFAWGEFLYSLTFLKDENLWPITVGMRQFTGQFGTSWNELMAVSALSTLPVIVIFIITQRYIIGGITVGAGK